MVSAQSRMAHVFLSGPMENGVLTFNLEAELAAYRNSLVGKKKCTLHGLEVTLSEASNKAIIAYISAQTPNRDIPVGAFAVNGAAGDRLNLFSKTDSVTRSTTYFQHLFIHTDIKLLLKDAISGEPCTFTNVDAILFFKSCE